MAATGGSNKTIDQDPANAAVHILGVCLRRQALLGGNVEQTLANLVAAQDERTGCRPGFRSKGSRKRGFAAALKTTDRDHSRPGRLRVSSGSLNVGASKLGTAS